MALGHGSKQGSYAVRGEITKQLGVIGLIVALGVWQHHFVLQAASADVYLFALLFGAGLYGIYNAIYGTHKLANEFIALQAMKEVYEDALWIKRSEAEAVEAQFRRTARPAIVYHVPHALATAHNLIVEEVQRNGSFRMPTGTMQVLVTDVETKLDDRQGMTHYLGALMVLLGLLGTFIGLMHTLESVGGILGSLDLSGSAGAGAIGSLIESLKLPLEGMSTGFGASLFGLIGSLIIGFLGKVDSKAAFRLKHEFETWIRSTVQIEGSLSGRETPGSVATPSQTDHHAGDLNSRTMLRVARSTVLATARMADQVASLASAIDITHRELSLQRVALDRLVSVSEQSCAVQAATELHVLSLSQNAAASWSSSLKLSEQVEHLFAAQQHANEMISGGQRHEAQRLRETIDSAVRGLRDVNRMASSIETCIVSLAQDAESREASNHRPASPPDVAALVADLDHLMAASRLQPRDVHNLRRLSALMVDPHSRPTVETVEAQNLEKRAS